MSTAPNIRNVRLGQCDITYNSVALGYTNGGVEVTIKNDVAEVAIDKYGSAPVRSYHKGTRIEVKAQLSEYVYTTLQQVINGTVVTGSVVTIGDQGGVALAGALLTLHPTTVTGTAQDVQIYKAVIIGESKLPFKLENETTYEVTWLALVDETKSDGNLLGRLGIVA